VEHGRVTVGVVGDPSRGEVVYAEVGQGAWVLRDGKSERLMVNPTSMTIVIEDGKAGEVQRKHAARFIGEAIRADRWEFRALGSTIALPYLAAGRVSAYVVFYVGSLHVAAGSLLVSEAGGIVSDIDGVPWTLQSESLLFSADAALHADLLKMAQATSRDRW
jgi:myo-inositol-1(or 4)-monophosphatase